MSSRQAILAYGAGFAVVFSACGAGDGNYPEIKGSLRKPVEQLNEAVATESCRRYATVLATAARPPGLKPGAPPTAAECRTYAPVLSRDLRGVRFRKARPFGTAALAEGLGPAQGRFSTALAIFVRDWDGRYRMQALTIRDPQLKTKPSAATNFGAQADAFVQAVRAKDCKQLQRYIVPESALTDGAAPSQATCRAVFGGKNLAPQLAADPKAKPVKLGATRDFAFYGLDTKRNYYTLILATQPPDRPKRAGVPPAGIFDYVPNEQPLG